MIWSNISSKRERRIRKQVTEEVRDKLVSKRASTQRWEAHLDELHDKLKEARER